MKIAVKIARIERISPTVKTFTLDLQGQAFTHLPGQWIDCFVDIDGRTEVAGYSITSPPATSSPVSPHTERGWFSIAVKLVGDNAVTDYMHEHAGVGDTLIVEGGQGDFCFDENAHDDRPIALIAGGIGITPIASIIRHIDQTAVQVPAALVYSASASSELLFRDEFETIAARNPNFRVHFTVTRPNDDAWNGNVGRIDAAMLRETGVGSDTRCYICGPPEMIRAMLSALKEIGVLEERLNYEQWW